MTTLTALSARVPQPTDSRQKRQAMATSIDVSDLDIYYGDFLAVEGVTMAIGARQVTALIGPSGCGKSTFLRALNRMHEVVLGARVSGKIVIDGQDMYAPEVDPVAVRRQVGMVFQRPNPFPTMSIYENVLAGVRLNNRRVSKGDADTVVRPLNGDRVADQWLAYRAAASAGAPIGRSRSDAGHTTDGRRYHVLRWYTGRGRKVLEYWTVHGLGHAWSGGRKNGSFSDPDGPRATTLMWAFFRLHALERQARRPARAAGA